MRTHNTISRTHTHTYTDTPPLSHKHHAGKEVGRRESLTLLLLVMEKLLDGEDEHAHLLLE